MNVGDLSFASGFPWSDYLCSPKAIKTTVAVVQAKVVYKDLVCGNRKRRDTGTGTQDAALMDPNFAHLVFHDPNR